MKIMSTPLARSKLNWISGLYIVHYLTVYPFALTNRGFSYVSQADEHTEPHGWSIQRGDVRYSIAHLLYSMERLLYSCRESVYR